MKKSFILLPLCVSLPATAADLAGRWSAHVPGSPGYESVILIDAENRVTWDAPLDNGRPAKFMGYIRHSDAIGAEMFMTDRVVVVAMHCRIESSDLLRCHTIRADKTVSPVFSLTRVGTAPAKLSPPR